jgi:hypothetical protein
MPCATTSRGSAAAARATPVIRTSTLPLATAVTSAVAVPPRPSARISASPARSRCTVAA